MPVTGRTSLRIAIAAGLGVGYGLSGLEAASPLAIPLLLWAVLVLLLVWRMPANFELLIGCTAALVAGFGIGWTVVLGQLIATCKPPSCQTSNAATDVFYAAALLVPLIIAGATLLTVRKILHR